MAWFADLWNWMYTMEGQSVGLYLFKALIVIAPLIPIVLGLITFFMIEAEDPWDEDAWAAGAMAAAVAFFIAIAWPIGFPLLLAALGFAVLAVIPFGIYYGHKALKKEPS